MSFWQEFEAYFAYIEVRLEYMEEVLRFTRKYVSLFIRTFYTIYLLASMGHELQGRDVLSIPSTTRICRIDMVSIPSEYRQE